MAPWKQIIGGVDTALSAVYVVTSSQTITHGLDVPAAATAGLVGRRTSVPLTQTRSTNLTVTEAYLSGFANRTISGVRFINGVTVQPGPGVGAFIIEDCLFEGACVDRLLNWGGDALGYAAAPVIVRNNTMTGDPTGSVAGAGKFAVINGENYDFIRNDVSGYGKGPHIWAGNVTVIENYIHDIIYVPASADHTNGVLWPGASNVTVDRNYIENLVIGDAFGGASAAISIYNEAGSALNGGFCRDNAIEGGSYALYGGCESGKSGTQAINLVITGNVWQRTEKRNSGDYGPAVAFDATRTGNVWSNNTWGALGPNNVGGDPAQGVLISSPGPS